MTAGQVANPFATPFKVPSIGTRTPSRSVRSKTMTEIGHSISFLLSSLEVCYTPFMQFPSPSTSTLQNLLTWNLLPNGQFNTSSTYTLSQNSPITPPPPTLPHPNLEMALENSYHSKNPNLPLAGLSQKNSHQLEILKDCIVFH